jgi:hypothetical protein
MMMIEGGRRRKGWCFCSFFLKGWAGVVGVGKEMENAVAGRKEGRNE